MVHWAFLILTFVFGFILGCLILYYLVCLLARIENNIKEAVRNWRL